VKPFVYERATGEDDALVRAGGARFLAGGTCLVDLMKLGVERPDRLVDLGALAGVRGRIEDRGNLLEIGALARNSDVAAHPVVRAAFPVLAEALLSGASPQLRNMATVGGNLLQRTRCSYFRDLASPCNKRVPGAGCAAWDGYNRGHAVLGGSDRCIAVNPSDMNVALVALDAVVHVRGPAGARQILAKEFHLAPVLRPEVETMLQPGELVTHVTLPRTPMAARSRYFKVRDRGSYEFALASAAVALDVREGTIRAARVVLGGVATKPWRCEGTEAALVGNAASEAVFERAASLAALGAVPRKYNEFKGELAARVVARALALAGGPA